jgi:hypothetical protein
MTTKRSSLHKTLLILLLVFIPPFWLLFTDDGARVSDTALLWLLGEEDIKLDVRKLDADFSREDIQSVYGASDWACGDKATEFGNAVCAARIGTFNGFPSRLLTFYFAGGRVSAMKLIYRDPYHDQLIGHFIGQLGQPGNVAAALADGPEADSVLEWPLRGGTLVMKKALGQGDEPAVMWVAAGGQTGTVN